MVIFKQERFNYKVSTASISGLVELLGNDHSSSLISAAEKVLRETTYTSNVKNWKIEDYITKHMDFHSILDDLTQTGSDRKS